jgi:hypothetical protein
MNHQVSVIKLELRYLEGCTHRECHLLLCINVNQTISLRIFEHHYLGILEISAYLVDNIQKVKDFHF